MKNRRQALCVLGAVCALPLSPLALAADYPEKPITLVVPFTAGSAPDVFSRSIGREITKATGAPVIVENRPGGSSAIAAQAVATAKPDGYTILISGNVAFTGNPHVLKKMTYDPVKDFTPITTLSKGAMYLYANPEKVRANNPKELMQMLKADPDKYTFGYTSITSRLPAEILQQNAGIKVVSVPYKSGASMLPDLIGGQIDMMFTDLSGLPHVKSGKLKAIGVSDDVRSPYTPNLPTFKEYGIEGMDVGFWLAAYLPANSPKPIVQKLHALMSAAMKSEEVQTALHTSGTVEFVQPLGQLEKFQANERESWGKVIRAAGIQPE